jgi:uncharacterized membrane protein
MRTPTHWLIAISLILNVLLIGFVAGQATMHRPHHGGWQKLAPEKQARLKEIMGDTHEQGRAKFKEIRVKRKEIAAILSAPEFDEAAFRAKSDEISKLFAAGKDEMIERIAVKAKTLSQEDRKLLAESMMSHRGGSRH